VLTHAASVLPSASAVAANRDEAEIWFDWAFVDFWKSNYCKWDADVRGIFS